MVVGKRGGFRRGLFLLLNDEQSRNFFFMKTV